MSNLQTGWAYTEGRVAEIKVCRERTEGTIVDLARIVGSDQPDNTCLVLGGMIQALGRAANQLADVEGDLRRAMKRYWVVPE